MVSLHHLILYVIMIWISDKYWKFLYCSLLLLLLHTLFLIYTISFTAVISIHICTIVYVGRITIWWFCSSSQYQFIFIHTSLNYVSRTTSYPYLLSWPSLFLSTCNIFLLRHIQWHNNPLFLSVVFIAPYLFVFTR